MNENQMKARIEEVLAQMEATALEERIAPVDCQKKPDHPDCQPVIRYGFPNPGDR